MSGIFSIIFMRMVADVLSADESPVERSGPPNFKLPLAMELYSTPILAIRHQYE